MRGCGALAWEKRQHQRQRQRQLNGHHMDGLVFSTCSAAAEGGALHHVVGVPCSRTLAQFQAGRRHRASARTACRQPRGPSRAGAGGSESSAAVLGAGCWVGVRARAGGAKETAVRPRRHARHWGAGARGRRGHGTGATERGQLHASDCRGAPDTGAGAANGGRGRVKARQMGRHTRPRRAPSRAAASAGCAPSGCLSGSPGRAPAKGSARVAWR